MQRPILAAFGRIANLGLVAIVAAVVVWFANPQVQSDDPTASTRPPQPGEVRGPGLAAFFAAYADTSLDQPPPTGPAARRWKLAPSQFSAMATENLHGLDRALAELIRTEPPGAPRAHELAREREEVRDELDRRDRAGLASRLD